MSAHTPLLPSRAIECVEEAGLSEAHKVLADFAAAGLIKTYALVRVTSPAGEPAQTVRDAAIAAELWQRIVAEGKASDALIGGTVRLSGSDLIGGDPDVQITGISFSAISLSKVLDRYCAQTTPVSSGKPKPVHAPPQEPDQNVEQPAEPIADLEYKASAAYPSRRPYRLGRADHASDRPWPYQNQRVDEGGDTSPEKVGQAYTYHR